ncbi:tetratricopeptide repeat protein [Proteiniclasticum sp. C24MP]|uniref:tetratricopeptide repeat protein n=1 Tax=Proteiniclasticum sp. C24MP TaxID=3374101 RepID=UPI0037540093
MKLKNLPIYDLIAIAGIFILIYAGFSTIANILIGAYLIFTVYRNYPTIQATKGSRAYNAGNTDIAMTYFEKAVKHPFAKPYIKSSFGYVLLREGRLDEAEPYLLEAAEMKTKDERFKYNNILNLAILNWKKGDIDKAIDIVENIREDYQNSIMYEILGYLYIAKGDYEKALEFNQEAYDYNKDDNVITDNLAQSYYFLGEYDKAEALYEDTIDYIKFPEAHYYYGIIKWKKGDYLSAYKALETSVRLKVSFLSIVDKDMLTGKFEELKKEMAEKGLDVETLKEEQKQEEEEKEAQEKLKREQEEESYIDDKKNEYKVD